MSLEMELVDRLHSVLVEEIRARRPQYLQQPFTVAEIYQDLVPYRSHRDRIGAAMNGDYEHALLELLAGAGGYVTLESEQARKRLLDELQSADPNTGIFREYAALDVRLNPAHIPRPRPAASSQADGVAPDAGETRPTRPSDASTTAAARPERGDGMQGRQVEASAVHGAATRPAPRPATSAAAEKTTQSPPASTVERVAPSNCRWCRAELPRRENLHFCPFCGTDVSLVPCPACGEELQPEWRFCIACGTQVPTED
jgi:hypothetical protein